MVCGDDSRGFMMEKAMVYALVCQAKQEIMRNRNKFSPKFQENRGPSPLSEPQIDVEEPQAHTAPHGSPQVMAKGLGISDYGSTPPMHPLSGLFRLPSFLTAVDLG